MDKGYVLEKLRYDPSATVQEKVELAKERKCLDLLIEEDNYYIAEAVGQYGTDDHRCILLTKWTDRDVLNSCIDFVEDPKRFMFFVKEGNDDVRWQLACDRRWAEYLVFDEVDWVAHRAFRTLPFVEKLSLWITHPVIALRIITM